MSICLLIAPIVLWLKQSYTPPNYSPGQLSKSKYPAPRQSMQGFHFTSAKDGVNILSVAADSFRIEKKKIGVFRLGLLEEARLHNAHFKIYGYSPAESLSRNTQATKSPSLSSENNAVKTLSRQTTSKKAHPGKTDFTLRDVFSRQAMPAVFTSKKLAFIVAEPVSLEVYDENAVITRFIADRGSFNLRQREIRLSGNVRVTSGDKTLETAELAIHPKYAMLKAMGDFVFRSPDGQYTGKRLITDIQLKPKNMMN